MIIVLVVIAVELLFISIRLMGIDILIEKIGYMIAHALDKEGGHNA